MIDELNAENIAREIKRFLEQHEGISLHPGRTPEAQGELVVSKGGCPCVPGRPNCPCPEAIDDIAELNHCRCYLFVNESYLILYDEMVTKRKSKNKPNLKGHESS